jgi:flagellar motor switch protein FliG
MTRQHHRIATGSSADALRKAAILIDSLDQPLAEAVLGQLPGEYVERIRQAVLELETVSREQRAEILAELQGAEPCAAANEVELEASLAEIIDQQADRELDAAAAASPGNSFLCLAHAPPDLLTDFLTGQHPQVVSVVLAHLPPRQAAEVLRRLTEERKRDVLQRMARLDRMDPDVLRQVEQGLQALLAEHAKRSPQRPDGIAAVEAILEASDEEQRRELLRHLAPQDSRASFSAQDAGREFASAAAEPASGDQISYGRLPADQYHQQLGSLLDALAAPPHADHRPATRRTSSEPAVVRPELALEFDDFARLDDTALARIFRAAAPQVTLLALCGASRDLVDRILGSLPLREARALRSQIEQLGPTRLSDIESAQLRLAELARRLADEGRIQVPRDRRFAVAA